MTDDAETLIDLGLSDPNRALQNILFRILDVTNGNDSDRTVANVRHAAVTLFKIADGLVEVTDADAVDALRGVLFHVCCLRNDGSIVFPDRTDDDDYPITAANLRATANVLMAIADDQMTKEKE